MKCRTPKCKGLQCFREVCNSCYCLVARLVREGKTTWKEQEKSGRVAPVSKERKKSRKQEWFTTK